MFALYLATFKKYAGIVLHKTYNCFLKYLKGAADYL